MALNDDLSDAEVLERFLNMNIDLQIEEAAMAEAGEIAGPYDWVVGPETVRRVTLAAIIGVLLVIALLCAGAALSV